MRRARDLEQRLTEWAKEYGGGRYGLDAQIESGVVVGASYGDSPLASMIKWRGRPPQGLGYSPTSTAADEVQEAYEALCKQEQGWMPAQVLRCEYCLPGQPIESKLQKLAKLGGPTSNIRYCQMLRLARIHIAGWLRIPFSESRAEEDAAAVD